MSRLAGQARVEPSRRWQHHFLFMTMNELSVIHAYGERAA